MRQTFTNDPALVAPVTEMMLGSREAVVDYMTPLGLHHLMAAGHHYGPGPWVSRRAARRLDVRSTTTAPTRTGIGFDRTATGSNAVSQYFPPVARALRQPGHGAGDDYLLWFHHVPWDHRMASGRTLWDELLYRYQAGVDAVRRMQATWRSLAGRVDAERYEQVRAFLAIQEQEARWWRDASVLYFQTFSKRADTAEGYEKPEHDLEYYMKVDKRYVPGI